MKVVILCGGKGLRYSSDKPKGLAVIGNKPIIHHVMNIYSIQHHSEFILILGHKSQEILNYFNSTEHGYNITYEFINEKMKTGGALKLAEHYIKTNSNFMCTYCDSIANINIPLLVETHNGTNNIATITVVHPNHIYGIVKTKFFTNKIASFEEKPKMKEWINGGFFIFSKDIFKYIYNEKDMLEKDIFERLVTHKKIGIYKHTGDWYTINTKKDEVELNNIYDNSKIHNSIEPWYSLTQK